MPFSKDSGASTGADKTPGNEPNQFAQVGMGGSQGGGQFEQGAGQSGSLQDQQGGTTTTRSVPIEHDHESEGQQQQGQNQQRAPGTGADDGDDIEDGRDDSMRQGDQGNFGS